MISQLEAPLFAFALRLTHHREDAQDLVQETWISAYRNRDKFTVGTNFRSWVSTIMRYTHLNRYRSQRSRRHLHHSLERVSAPR